MSKHLYVKACSLVSPSREPNWTENVPPAVKRRDPRIWQMAHLAALRVLTKVETPAKSIVTATALGALDETKSFLDGVFTDGFGSPRNFIASVHNSMAGKLALDFKVSGPNLTICDGQNSFASSLQAASLLNDNDFPIILLTIDERIALLDTLQPYFSDSCAPYLKPMWEEAAVAFFLTKEPESGSTRICGCGPSPIYKADPLPAIISLLTSNKMNSRLLPLDQTSTSFVQPAISAYDHITKGSKESVALGSYSPAGQSVAVAELHYDT